jgi:hypothetical protein
VDGGEDLERYHGEIKDVEEEKTGKRSEAGIKAKVRESERQASR